MVDISRNVLRSTFTENFSPLLPFARHSVFAYGLLCWTEADRLTWSSLVEVCHLPSKFQFGHARTERYGGWLAVEEQFYLIWTLVVLFLNTRQIKRLCIALFALAILSRYILVCVEVPSGRSSMTQQEFETGFGKFKKSLK